MDMSNNWRKMHGIPMRRRKGKKPNVIVICKIKDNANSMVLGMTGRGMPLAQRLAFVRAFAKVKENCVVTDPKGEFLEQEE